MIAQCKFKCQINFSYLSFLSNLEFFSNNNGYSGQRIHIIITLTHSFN